MKRLGRELGLLVFLLLFALVLGLFTPGFFAAGNLKNLALDNLPLWLRRRA